jgi:hypothetical protein
MVKGEVECEHPEEILAKIRLTSEIYDPLHKIFKPNWVKDIKPKANFYDGTHIKRPQGFINMITGELVRTNFAPNRFGAQKPSTTQLFPFSDDKEKEFNVVNEAMDWSYGLSEDDFDNEPVQNPLPKNKSKESDNQRRIEEALRKL